jgi:hypothetical protein
MIRSGLYTLFVTTKQRTVVLWAALLLAAAVWQMGRVHRASSVVPDALERHGFTLTFDFEEGKSRLRRFHSDAPINEVKHDFIEQMTAAGWDANEKAAHGRVGVSFGRGHYSKGMLVGAVDGLNGTWFDLHDHITIEGKVKSMFGLDY